VQIFEIVTEGKFSQKQMFEKAFSLMKLNKSPQRNRLTKEYMTPLL
jgi:hypothetical protein